MLWLCLQLVLKGGEIPCQLILFGFVLCFSFKGAAFCPRVKSPLANRRVEGDHLTDGVFCCSWLHYLLESIGLCAHLLQVPRDHPAHAWAFSLRTLTCFVCACSMARGPDACVLHSSLPAAKSHSCAALPHPLLENIIIYNLIIVPFVIYRNYRHC